MAKEDELQKARARIKELEGELVTSLETQLQAGAKPSEPGNLIPCPFKGEREPETRVVKNQVGVILVTLHKGDIAIGACHKGKCWYRMPLGVSYQPCPVCKGAGKVDPNAPIPDTAIPLQPKIEEGVA